MMLRAVAGMTAALALTVAVAFAGSANQDRPSTATANVQDNTAYNGQFIFARLRYDMGREGLMGGMRRGFRGRGGDPPWRHDYPFAERNLMNLMREITALHPGAEAGNIVDIGDPELHRYPIAYMSEPGYWTMNDQEVENMRSYLLKGGFLIFDDFPYQAWGNFEQQMRRILPDMQIQPLDATHPIFHSFFAIESLQNVYGTYLGQPVFLGIFENNEPNKRLMAIINFQNDLGENWEYSGRGFSVIPEAANEAYKFGVNYILYGMTH